MAINQTLAVILKAQDDTKGAFNSLNNNLNQLKTAAKALVAALAFKDVIDSTNQLGQQIDMLRDNLGISAQEASRLNYAARVMGTSAEEVSASFGALNRKLIDQMPLIAQGKSDFDKWGVAAKNAQGNIVSFPELINNVRDRLRTLPPGLERSGAAMDLMGRSGRQLLDLMTLTDAQFKSLAQEAQDLGLIFDEAGVDSMEDFQHNLNRLNLEFDALKLQLGQAIMPLLRSLVQWIRQNSGVFKQFGEVAKGLAGTAKVVADALGNIWDKLKGIFGTTEATQLAVDAFILTIAGIAGGPVGLAIAALVLAFGEVQKTIKFIQDNWDLFVYALRTGQLNDIPIFGFFFRIVSDVLKKIDDLKIIWNNLKTLFGQGDSGGHIPILDAISEGANIALAGLNAVLEALGLMKVENSNAATAGSNGLSGFGPGGAAGAGAGGGGGGSFGGSGGGSWGGGSTTQPDCAPGFIAVKWADGTWQCVPSGGGGGGTNLTPMATGGYVGQTMAALLHPGETVIPANGSGGSGVTNIFNVTGNIATSEAELARRIADEVGSVLIGKTLMNRNLAY